jgi:hypothetical protein
MAKQPGSQGTNKSKKLPAATPTVTPPPNDEEERLILQQKVLAKRATPAEHERYQTLCENRKHRFEEVSLAATLARARKAKSRT